MLILLDIDGVMVQGSSWKPVESLSDGFYKFNPKAVSSLQDIILETDAAIVLTTSHKDRYTPREWKTIFLNRGINVSKVSKLRTRKIYANRKEEILTWYKRHKEIDNFVIIDDDKSLNGLPQELKDKLVLTNSSIGLTHTDAIQALKVLKKK